MPRTPTHGQQYGPIRLQAELLADIRAEAEHRRLTIADVIRERLAARPYRKEPPPE